MPLIHRYNGTDLTDAVQLTDEGSGFAASAKLGEAEIVTVTVDDPGATRSFTGHKVWTMREAACAAGNQVAWYGFVGRKVVRRRNYRSTTARVWDLTLVEANTYTVRRVLLPTATTTARPAETVSTRITWLLTTVGFSGLIVDHGLVAASAVTMDAFDYTNMTGADVLRDCALASGYNFHIRYREASSDFELIFLDFATSDLDQSSLRVSNDLDDVDGATTWAANPDAEIEQIPDRVASTVVLPHQGGTAVNTSAGTASTFAAIDLVAPTASVSSAVTAATLAARLQVQHSTEEEKVTGLWIDVPVANLNDVKPGQLIQAKLTHGPGWTTFRSARVTRRVFARPPNTSEDRWRVGLELQPAVIATTVYSEARLMRPSKSAGADIGYIGSGTYSPVHHLNDGDNPASGDTTYPLVGLFEYVGSVGDRTGIRALGAGTITVVLAFSCAKVAAAPHTFTANILKNGGSMFSDFLTESKGLTYYSWEPTAGTSLTTSFAVVTNDVITWSINTSTSSTLNALPAGVGSGSHWLFVYGSLVA
jgi:hypothetical protein